MTDNNLEADVKWSRKNAKAFFAHHLKKIKQWLALRLPKVAFVGHLTKCSLGDYWGAGVEYLHSMVWSTMPFWLGAGLLFVQSKSGDTPILEIFTSTFKNGELLVYTISTLTPITFYTLFEDPKGRFPHRLGIGTITIIIIISCAALFALQKAQVETKADYIFTGSLWFAGIAILLRYLATLYNKTKIEITTEKDFIRPSKDFIEDFDYELDMRGASQLPTISSQAGQALDDALAAVTPDPIPNQSNGGAHA